MKHMKKLLFLVAGAMMGVCAQAQNFTLQREQPAAPEYTTWNAEDTIYLYNIDGGGFYTNHRGGTGSPYWGTRACVNDTIGSKVIFTRTNPAGGDYDLPEDWTEGESNGSCLSTTYLLVGYVSKFSAYMCTYTTDWQSIWTDNNTAAYRYFNVVKNSDKSFKIERNMKMAGVTDGAVSEGWYLGVDDEGICFLDTLGGGMGYAINWAAVSPSVYDSYIESAKEQLALYSAGESLKKAIQAAYDSNPGIDLSSQLAVYNNASSTVAEMEAAQATIAQAIVDFVSSKGSVDNPVDLTSALTNTTFDTVGDFTGWKGTSFGAGGTTGPSAEHYGHAYDTYQYIVGAQPGVYKLTANGFFRKSDVSTDWSNWLAGTKSDAKLYIKGATYGTFATAIKHIAEGYSTSSVTTASSESNADVTDADGNSLNIYVPNTMLAADDYFHNADGTSTDRYYNEVYGALAEGDTLFIGVQNTVGGSSDWSIFDDFQLYYLGNSDEAYDVLKNNALEANTYTVPEDTYYSQAELDTYTQAYAALQAASGADVFDKIDAVSAAVDSVQNSVSSYTTYIELVNTIENWLSEGESSGMNMEIDEVAYLADYIQAESSDDTDFGYPNGVLNEVITNYQNGGMGGKLTNQQILVEYDSLYAWYQQATKNALVPGADLTSLITNPGFEEADGKGWSLDSSAGGTSSLTNWHGGDATNYCAEAYQQNFDVYQIVTGLPNGLYSVSVQAFYRTGENSVAYEAYLADPEMTGDAKVYPEVYFNDFSAKVRNVMEIRYTENLGSNCYSCADGTYSLNGMTSASAAFSLEDESQNFTMNCYGLVTDGTMRLGIRKLEGATDSQQWTLWDNFKITYVGKDADALSSVIDNYLERAAELDDAEYGTPDKTALATAVANAEAAQASGDADQMYEALDALVKAVNTANSSVTTYTDMATTLESLMNAIGNYPEASQEAQEAASNLYDEVDGYLSSYELSGEDLAVYEDKINDAIAELKVIEPNDDVSDENPQDYSGMIINPTFDTIGDFTGWSSGFAAGGTTSTCAEVYNATFNVYQDIVKLPAGMYEVKVNAFMRVGSATNDYTEWSNENGGEATSVTTYLYATGSEGTASVRVKHICDGGLSTSDLGSVNAAENAHGECYVPNTMAEADSYFHMTGDDGEALNVYEVSLYVKVGDDGKLRIGVYNQDANLPSTSWSLFDDFQLYYLGTESSHAQDADNGAVRIDGVSSDTQVVSSAIYSLSGARMSGLQRGINIVKQQQADGTVKVLKVLVK